MKFNNLIISFDDDKKKQEYGYAYRINHPDFNRSRCSEF